MGQAFTIDWDDVRELLNHEIQVFYTKDENTNQERDRNKKRTINWIIDRMKEGARPGGTRIVPPEYTATFGDLWPSVRKAMRLYYSRCALCGDVAEEVHHIRPRFLRGSPYDPCNLVCLCRGCHDQVHHNLDDNICKAVADSIHIRTNRRYKTEPLEGWE